MPLPPDTLVGASAASLDRSWVEAVLERVSDALRTGSAAINLDGIRPAKARLERTFVEVLRLVLIHVSDESRVSAAPWFAAIEAAAFERSTTPKNIADSCGVSESTLARRCSEIAGSSVMDVVRAVRVREGFRRLTLTNDAIKTIAIEVGFSEAAFRRHLRRAYGVSPTEIRRRG